MRNDYDNLLKSVLTAMERTPDERLREILTSLVRHLHSFVRDVRMTEAEFRAATAIVSELGQQSNELYNETVLMAGSLGISSLICLLNNDSGAGGTSQNLLGPFWRLHSPPTENGGSIVRSLTPGPALFFSGRLLDRDGQPVAEAEVDVWHSSPDGLYENQDPGQAGMNLRGKFVTDAEGRFWFQTVKPAGYPIPMEGVAGRMLKAQLRQPFRPAHLHVLAYKFGYKTLISQVYSDDDAHLESDPQFGVTDALIGRYERHKEPHSARADIQPPWYSLDFSFTIQPGDSVLPVPPIR